MSGIDDIKFKIARLDLRPGDILVVKCSDLLTREATVHLHEVIQRIIPGQKALILEHGMDLAILTAAEIAERTV
jgi:hypothetical protein